MAQYPKSNRVNKRIVSLDDIEGIQQTRKDLAALETELAQFDAVNARLLADDLQRKYVEPAILELKWYPPKQQGQKYKRTYKLRRGWEGRAVVARNEIRILFDNAVKYRRFVQGLIGLGISRSSLSRYTAPIQKYHLEHGWRAAAPIIQKYTNQMREYAVASTTQRVNTLIAKHISR